MRKLILFALFGSLMLSLLHCTLPEKIQSSEQRERQAAIMEKTWRLQAMIVDGYQIEMPADSIPRLHFKAESLELVAYCNTFAGPYTFKEKDIFSTQIEMAISLSCETSISNFEKYLLSIMKKAKKLRLEKAALLIYQNDSTILMFRAES